MFFLIVYYFILLKVYAIVYFYITGFLNYKETTRILEIIVNLSIIPMTLSVVFITISVARDRQELLIFGLKETECPLSLFPLAFVYS